MIKTLFAIFTVVLLIISCSKSPSQPEDIPTPPIDSLPATDTGGSDGPPVLPASSVPGDIIIRTEYDTVVISFKITKDEKQRVTSFKVYPHDTTYSKDFQFVYTNASGNYPAEYNLVSNREGGSSVIMERHQIFFSNGIPVRDTLLYPNNYEYTNYIWTKDSIIQTYIQIGGTTYKKRMLFSNENLSNVNISTHQLNASKDVQARDAGYSYTDTLNPYYLPYIAPFVESIDRYFPYLRDRLFSKYTMQKFNIEFDGFLARDYLYFDNEYNSEHKPVALREWHIADINRKEYQWWTEMKY